MKLIIDISEELYAKVPYLINKGNVLIRDILDAVENGTQMETQPSDAVSRSEALKRIDAERQHLLDIKMDGAEHILVHHARRIIEDLPSVQPQPKMGQWIKKYDGIEKVSFWECSNCHKGTYEKPKYCNNCEIYMENGEEK
jgi:hypothetical protein